MRGFLFLAARVNYLTPHTVRHDISSEGQKREFISVKISEFSIGVQILLVSIFEVIGIFSFINVTPQHILLNLKFQNFSFISNLRNFLIDRKYQQWSVVRWKLVGHDHWEVRNQGSTSCKRQRDSIFIEWHRY